MMEEARSLLPFAMEVLSLVKAASPLPTPPHPKRSPHSSNVSKDSIFFRRTWSAQTHFSRAVAATRLRAVGKLGEVWPERMEEDDEREGERKGEVEEDEEVGKKKTFGAKELEELEAAAMEGKDEGREPSDYDRRARIFYESSRVFGKRRSVESS